VPDVFVSYARTDSVFVSRLVESIESRGKDVWVDTEGIADGEVFPEAIKRAIEQSDAFVFVITPDSVASAYCENEVEYARDMQKRIVPILRVPVPDPQLPTEIRVRNWIPFTDAAQFDASVARLVGALDTDLEAVRAHTRWLVKALEWDSEGRERSRLLRGAELRSAEAWLAGSPEGAEPAPTQLQREYLLASRQAAARRQRTLVGASLAVAVVSVGLLVFALISRGEAINEQQTASSRALASRSEAELTVDPEISVLLGMRAVRTKPTPDAMFALREALDASPLLLSLSSGGSPESCEPQAAYDPRSGEIAEEPCPGEVELLSPASGAVLHSARISSDDYNLAFSPNGSLLAVSGPNGITLLNGSTLVVERRLTGFSKPGWIAFSPNGQTVAASGVAGIDLWNVASGRQRALVVDRTHPETSNYDGLAFTAGGHELVVGTQFNYAAVYDVGTGQLLHKIPALDGGVMVAADPVAAEVAVTTGSSTEGFAVSLWATNDWTRISTPVKVSGTAISAIAFSPNGRELAVGGDDGIAGLWSLSGDNELLPLVGHTAGIDSVSFAPDGHELVTGSADGSLREWRTVGAEQLEIAQRAVVEQLAAASGRLYSLGQTSDEETLDTWSLPGGQPFAPPLSLGFSELNGFNQLAAQITPGGRFALVYGKFGAKHVGVWNVAQRRLVHDLAPIHLDAAALSPDGTRLAEMVASGPLQILTLAGGATVHLAGRAPECLFQNAAFSPDGRYLVAASFCGEVDVWDARSGHLLRHFNEGGQIAAVAMAPDDAHVAIASWDTTATLLDFLSGRTIALTGHTGGVNGVAYSPNGRDVLTTSVDDTARLWEARSGRLLRIYRDPALVDAPAFSPDGGMVYAADETGEIRGWETCPACDDPAALLAIAMRAQKGIHKLTTLEQAAARGD